MALTTEQRMANRSRKERMGRIASIAAPAIIFLLLLAVWQAAVVILNIPAWLLPKPTRIFLAMFRNFKEFLPHIIRSYSTIILGFLWATATGITLAAFLSNFKLLGVALTPYIIFLCTTPVITLVPLLLLFFGFGQWVMVFAVMLQAFPILNMNAGTGFDNVPILQLELMRSLRASRLQTFFHCTFPASLPSVFTGMKLSSIFSTTACISSEFSGGNKGLGANIIIYTQFMATDKAFACIFYVAAIGLFLYTAINVLESKVIKWKI